MRDDGEIRRSVQAKIDEIPTLPAVVPRILSVLQDDEASAAQIAEVIAHDPSLTSKILRVANSAYYGFSGQVSSLQKAIILVGLRMVKSLALSIPVVYGLPAGRGLLPREGLWIHSLAVSTAMQRLARAAGRGQEEHLFIVGLLHDIGKIILAEFFEHSFRQALSAVDSGAETYLFEAEREVLGIDHAEVAGILLRRWRFPARIADPVALHHATEVPEDVARGDVAILRLANFLVQEMGVGAAGNRRCPPVELEDFKTLHLGPSALQDVRDHLASRSRGIAEFYAAIF